MNERESAKHKVACEVSRNMEGVYLIFAHLNRFTEAQLDTAIEFHKIEREILKSAIAGSDYEMLEKIEKVALGLYHYPDFQIPESLDDAKDN